MSLALAVSVSLEQFVCGECGGTYAIAERVVAQKREKGGYWHCPYCQCSWGYHESELQKAQKALAAEKDRHTATLSRLNVAAAERDQLAKKHARLQKRIEKGVCPCCNRTFLNLQKHMATKHPEFP